MIYLYILIFLALLLNFIAIMHAYKFTHYDETKVKSATKTKLTLKKRLRGLFFGINLAKPRNIITPSEEFEEVILKSNSYIHCWLIRNSSKKTVIFFHGYSEDKSLMLERAELFIKENYNVFLVDLMGTGSSQGNNTTIGFKESFDVNASFEYISEIIGSDITLYGVSMGSTSIMKAINDYNIKPTKIILECPFGSMYDAVKSRCRRMGLPVFPMSHLLIFWGGALNGFNAFTHKPTEFAKSIYCPTLLLKGEKDFRVTEKETNDIFANLQGEKFLKTYPNSDHESYINNDYELWKNDVLKFLEPGL